MLDVGRSRTETDINQQARPAVSVADDPKATWPASFLLYRTTPFSANHMLGCGPRPETKPMRRREFITLIGSAAAVPLLRVPVARAQEPGRTYKLGVITGAARQAPRNVALFDELKRSGFVEGQNLKIVVDGFGLRDEQFAEAAATLAKSAPDVIFCVGDPAMRAAQESTRTVPIVGLAGDMVVAGFVRSLARPGGNVTGVSITFAIDGKRQDLLMEAVPEARRFALLTDPTFTPPAQLSALQNATRARGVEVAVFKAGTPEQIAPTMDEAKAWGATALNVLGTPLFSFNRRIVIERAAALGLPAIYQWPEMAEEGGLIGYGARLPRVYRQLARLLVKVLRGVNPEDIPVEEPDKFDLVVNLKTAKAIGLTIPESFLSRADEVIE
jgi:putative tryptophan/tyrosine transport system substrate-binding protein